MDVKLSGRSATSERDGRWWVGLACVTLLSFVTRMNKIDEPPHVCWDETHFGKMASWYINRTLFFDVHPPLGKMLVALGGVIGGYNGSFAFSKPGDPFPADVPYVFIRSFCAMFGVAIVPLCYCITWLLSKSTCASVLSASLVLFDTGTLTLTQFILLDPFLLFFITASTFSYLKFWSCRNECFTFSWWLWLSLTGIFLACSISVKFVGLFVILLIGLSTIGELWQMIGDLSNPISNILKQFLARILCLVMLPIVVYLFIFKVHFMILSKSGPGDGFFSSAFQSQLEGNALYNICMPKYIAYGSVVTIKNYRTGGNYLHSHWHLYPESLGVQQQQVTAYSHKDENNRWLIKRRFETSKSTGKDLELVRNGDFIRLQHVATGRNLHGHKERAPLTRRHYQITCYGENGTGDVNDVFQISVPSASSGEPVRTVQSVFRLVHMNVGCALHSHDVQLPKWGWEQLEVTCNPNVQHLNNLWNIEQVSDTRLENSSFEVYRLNFLDQFLEFHSVMIRGNRGLKPKDGELTSLPWQWPINYRGQPFSGPEYCVYLLGNPIIWWTSFATMTIFIIVGIAYACRNRRLGKVEATSGHCVVFNAGWWLVLAWAIHYFPFWSMGRILYFHHYFPAAIYCFILTGMTWDAFVTYLCSKLDEFGSWCCRHLIIGSLFSGVAYSFYLFSPLSYGVDDEPEEGKSAVLNRIKWLNSWDI